MITAASDQIQQLEAALNETQEPSERVDLLNELAWLIREEDLERAVALSEEARRRAAEPGEDEDGVPYDEGLARSLHQLGRFRLWVADLGAALGFFAQAQSLYEKLDNQAEVARQILYQGVTHGRAGNYPEALRHLIKSQEISDEMGDRELEALALNSIGYLHVRTAQPAKALPYLEKSLRIARDLEDEIQEAWVLDSLCSAHLALEQYEEALAYGLASVQHLDKVGTHLGKVECLISVGDVYLARGDHAEALDYVRQALSTSLEHQFRREAAEARQRIGEIYRRQGRLDEAIVELKQAVEVAHAIEDKELEARAHRTLASVYQQRDDYRTALTHCEIFRELEAEVFDEEADRRLKTLQVVYEAESARREAAIAHLKNVALQEEIEERQRAERALQEEIEAHQQLIADLDAFAHMVAHDLKNPLHIIAGYGEILEEQLADQEDDLTLEIVEIIQQTARKMDRIIDTMLLLAKVPQEEIELEVLKMGPIVTEVKTRLVRLIQERQARIVEPRSWPAALGYAPWVEEVWENYLSNALKYGGHPPRLELGATRQGKKVRFWVRDNGVGLTPEQKERLFTPFTRLELKGRSGHGLGLSIVKRIVEKMGGEVGAESVLGEGSIFHFTLPAAEAGTEKDETTAD